MVSKYYNSLRRDMSNTDPNTFKKKVFISYARKDKELIQSFIDSGENRDFDFWVDQANIAPGTNWKQRIFDEIYDSDGAILFISSNSLRADSPINKYEIPHFIKRNNDPNDKFQFFPVFLDYVDQEIVENYEFTSELNGEQEKLFETYDIWNIEANKKSDLEHEMPSEMSKNKREKFWADLNSQMSNALHGRKVTKVGDPQYWDSNPLKAKEYKRKRNVKRLGYGLLVVAVLLTSYLISRPQESDQTSEVFTIGGAVPIGALTTGDCFNLIEENTDLSWNTYVQYRACNLLHDGEVFYHESQIDFGDNQVGYSNLLNLFSQTCNEKFSEFSSSSFIPENYDIRYFWDTDSQALGSKPFDMNCLTLSDTKTTGSYVEDITGVRLILPNPGDKYDCDDFDSREDSQIWFDLYFDDYGDVAFLDLNNNGIACDELRSNAISTTTSTTTPSTTTPSTTNTTTSTSTTVVKSLGNVYENKLIQFDDVSFNVSEVVKNSPNKVPITNYYNINDSVASWNNSVGLRIETHWRSGVHVKWNACDYSMGCMYKLSINGVNVGSHYFEGTYYVLNNNFFIGGLATDKSYQIKLEPIDGVYQSYTPSYLSFSGNDWNNDNGFNPGWPLVYEIEGFKIYADQINWFPPKSNNDPVIQINDRGNQYEFILEEWDIEFKKFAIGVTHYLLFVDTDLIGMIGNGTPGYYSFDKSLIGNQTLNGKTLTLIAYDTPVFPGATFSFKYDG